MVLVIAGDPGDHPFISDLYFLAEQNPKQVC